MEYNLKEVILGNQNVRFVCIYIYILTMHADNSSSYAHQNFEYASGTQ
jgi:hypothetical protein